MLINLDFDFYSINAVAFLESIMLLFLYYYMCKKYKHILQPSSYKLFQFFLLNVDSMIISRHTSFHFLSYAYAKSV